MTNVIEFSIVFLVGFLSCLAIILMLLYVDIEQPFSFFSTEKNISPSNSISKSQIEVYDDKVIINIPKASLGNYAPTGSMLPVLSENSTGIKISVKSEEEINVGDIITFKSGEDLIIHRVIEIGKDEQGTYFITKGDNSPVSDGKIRFKQIFYKTVGVLW